MKNHDSRLNPIFIAMVVAGLASTTSYINAEENPDVERMQITGSKIKRTDIETASPVSVISSRILNLIIINVPAL